MRIGILKFHRSINYGAFMQCYALSHELMSRYPEHQIEVIDFEYLRKHDMYKAPLKHIPLGIEYYIKYQRFQFDLKRLPLSSKTFITENTDNLCNFIRTTYDIVIVGSDAVWAFQGKMPVDNPYWLFGNRLKNVVKMSFAASAFSTRFETISQEERCLIKDHLSSFYYIGVRDDATKSFVDSLGLGKIVNLNHDPSIFLNPATDIQLAKKTLRKNFVFNNKKSISFMTRSLPNINKLRKDLSEKYNLLHFYIRDNTKRDLIDRRCRFMNNVSPYEWYNLYGQMSLNITHFFHGACLGIINHVPTIVVDDFDQNYMSKYAQLMTNLGLTDRLFYQNNFDSEKFIDTVYYCLTHKEEESNRIVDAIQRERKKSESFFIALDDILRKGRNDRN